LSPITTSRPDEDEDDFIEDAEDDEELEQVSAPAVSDRRRRRQVKHGEPVAEVAVQQTRKDRPTPSQQHPEGAKSKNPVVHFWQNTVEYFQEVKAELSKVVWLNREELLRLTYIVILVTAVSAIFLGLVSYIFGLLTQALTTNTLLAGGVTIGLIVVVGGGWLFRERLFGRFD